MSVINIGEIKKGIYKLPVSNKKQALLLWLSQTPGHETFADQAAAQRRFDSWRDSYNLERPHQALALKPPISRYQHSTRPYPESLPLIEYGLTTRCEK